MSNTLAYKSWALDAIAFTEITAPINCDYVVLLNADDTITITLRSDPDDAATEKSLLPGVQEVFMGAGHHYRFSVGATVVYAKAASATATLHTSFLL